MLVIKQPWISRLGEFAQLKVGFSGGLDSTVLLHSLAAHSSLASKLTAVHINHGIHPEAPLWQTHCQQFCLNLGIPFQAHSVQFSREANLEEEARKARYTFFSSLLGVQDGLILAHHRDDQAETVLLQLFRGAGVDGLAAMAESSSLGLGTLLRPFLTTSRQALEGYAEEHNLQWVEDQSNQDIYYSRNYLRHEILPLLEKKWPGVKNNLTRTAKHCQEAKRNLEALAKADHWGLLEATTSIESDSLKKLSQDRLSNVLRAWLKKNHVPLPSTTTFQRLIHELLFSSPDARPEVSWKGFCVRSYQQHLYLDLEVRNKLIKYPCVFWTNFPSSLALTEPPLNLIAKKSKQGLVLPDKAEVLVRFREGGERFCWHGQTKQLKKLFQEWAIPPWRRDRVPLIYVQGKLAAVVGYAISDLFFSKDAKEAWHISAFRHIHC